MPVNFNDASYWDDEADQDTFALEDQAAPAAQVAGARAPEAASFDDPAYWEEEPEVVAPKEDAGVGERLKAGFGHATASIGQSVAENINEFRRSTKFHPQNYLTAEQKQEALNRQPPLISAPMGWRDELEIRRTLPNALPKKKPVFFEEWMRELTPEQVAQREKDMFSDPEYRQTLETAKLLGEAAKQRMAGYEDSDLAQLASGVTRMVPTLAVGALTRSPTLALSFMGTDMFGTALAEGREMGLDEATNTSRAILIAASETIPEVIPLSMFLGKGTKLGKSFLMNYIKGAGAEGVSEVLTEVLQVGIDKGLYEEGASLQGALRTLASPEGLEQIAQAGKMGIYMGLALGGPGAYKGASDKKKESEDAANKLRQQMADAEKHIRDEGELSGKSEIEVLIEINEAMTGFDTRIAELDQEAVLNAQLGDEIDAEIKEMDKVSLRGKVAEGFQANEDAAKDQIAQEIIKAEQERQLQLIKEPAIQTVGQNMEELRKADEAGGSRPINPAMAEALLAAGVRPTEVVARMEMEREADAVAEKAPETAPGTRLEDTDPAEARRVKREAKAAQETADAIASGAVYDTAAGKVAAEAKAEPKPGEAVELGTDAAKAQRQARKEERAAERRLELERAKNAPRKQFPFRGAAAEKAAVDVEANVAATSPQNELPEPSEAQIDAGNYKKGHVKVAGLDISIENPAGSTRTGTRADGSKWSTKIKNHYGYIRGTESAEGPTQQLDVFLGDKLDSDTVYVVDQVDQSTGAFDEHKALIGFGSNLEAVKAYRQNYQSGWKVGKVTEMPMKDFKAWSAARGNKSEPLHRSTPIAAQPGEVEARQQRIGGRRPRSPEGKVRFSKRMSDGATFEATEDRGHHKVRVTDSRGRQIGRIEAMESTDAGLLRVMRSDVFDEADRGKGHGVRMYNEVLKLARSKGLKLASDISVSPGAQRVYRALAERGAKVTTNPHTVNPTTGAMVSTDIRVPVFEVEPTDIRLRLADVTPADTKLTIEAVKETLAPLVEKLGVRNFQVLQSDPLGKGASGAYDPKGNTVTLYLEGLETMSDAIEVLLHEGVAHQGLRFLLDGPSLGRLLRDVYNNMDPAIREAHMAKMQRLGYDLNDIHEIAEEYIAFVAENGDNAGTLQKVYDAIRSALRQIGVVQNWTDNDIRALLRETQSALRQGRPLKNIDLQYTVTNSDTGESFQVTQNAEVALRQTDKRMGAIARLKECVKK